MEATVVIPFYNAESTLARAIDSVLAQENVKLEIFLIDNNSSDQSHTIARSYADKHVNISLVFETKQGANHARNLGMLLAKKEWIQYLDADDELLPKKIFNQLSITGIESVDVICSPITEHTNNSAIINYHVSEMGDVWLSLLQGKIGWTCSNLWRTTALIDIGGWNTNYTSHQEKELMARLIIEGKAFHFYDKSECIVYEQSSSISKRTDFPLTGVKFMKYLTHYFTSNDIMNPEREKAIQNELYHKLLMAYKINPEEAKNAMFNTVLNLEIIDLPITHRILTSIMSIQNTFGVLRILS